MPRHPKELLLSKEELKRRKALRHKKWRAKNQERLRVYAKAYRDNNIELAREYDRKYYAERMPLDRKKRKWDSLKKFMDQNPEYANQYYRTHKTEAHARASKRRASVFKQTHPDIDIKRVVEIYRSCEAVTCASGIKHEVDHIIPLSKGGWHHQDNLQIIPEFENRSKADNPFWEKDGFRSWRDVPESLWPESLKNQYEDKK